MDVGFTRRSHGSPLFGLTVRSHTQTFRMHLTLPSVSCVPGVEGVCEGVRVWCGVCVCVRLCVWGGWGWGGGSAEFGGVEAVDSGNVVNKDEAETAQSGVRPL